MRKFYGLVCVVMTTAFLSLCSMEDQSDAGLLGRLFRAGAYSSCGGGGGLQSYGAYSSCGGGGGLQSAYYGAYSSCGGGGGGLQYAPATTYYYSAPAIQYAPASYNSGCPGGVCPPSASDGFTFYGTYSPTYYAASTYNAVPPGVRLNPGERYVAGSLRVVAPSQTIAGTQTRHKTQETPARASQSLTEAENTLSASSGAAVLYQISQEGCIHCVADLKHAKEAGVKVEVLHLDNADDARKIATLWRGSPCDFTGTPSYVLTIDGKPRKWRDKSASNAKTFTAMAKTATRLGGTGLIVANVSPATPQTTAKVESTVDSKSPIEVRMMNLETKVRTIQTDMAEIRKLLEQKVAKR